MKVMALNSSARVGTESKTEIMLNALVEGMRDAGAEVEIVNLFRKKVNYCIGCFTCWTKTPGVCIHKDDMSSELLPRFAEADLAVLATPLFHFTVNAEMKAFIERTLPLIEPYLKRTNTGQTYHPLRGKHPGIVAVSVAGFPEDSVFDQLSSYMNFLYSKGLLAEIYRSGAESLASSFMREQFEDILDATRQAGRELVRTFSVSPETMAVIRQPLDDVDKMCDLANCVWDTCIAEKVTPREFGRQGLVPRANSVRTFLYLLEMAFNADAAGDTRAVIQCNFSGDKGGECFLDIAGGSLKASEGKAEKADLTVNAPFDLWVDIMTGRADGQDMFMTGQYTVEGDMNLLIKMGELFSRRK